MPLVRIITRLREYPTELVRDLRTRGYEVETCLSQDEKQEAADLEITLDQCSAENISESISHALAHKDVVILADANADGGKIRSIGMVLMSSESRVQTDRKTAVPVQFNEIYTALLRGRLQPRKFSELAGSQRLSSTWKYCQAAGRSLGRVGMRTVATAGIWAKSWKLSWAEGYTNSSKREPDLVPSMFSLSGPIADSSEPTQQNQDFASPIPATKENKFRLWKPVTAGVVAILAVTLWVHGFSDTRLNAEQSSGEKKEAQSQTLVPAAQVMQKVSPAPKMQAKSSPSGDDDSFQEVVVRHFAQPAPSAFPKDGIKRRVVVD